MHSSPTIVVRHAWKSICDGIQSALKNNTSIHVWEGVIIINVHFLIVVHKSPLCLIKRWLNIIIKSGSWMPPWNLVVEHHINWWWCTDYKIWCSPCIWPLSFFWVQHPLLSGEIFPLLTFLPLLSEVVMVLSCILELRSLKSWTNSIESFT